MFVITNKLCRKYQNLNKQKNKMRKSRKVRRFFIHSLIVGFFKQRNKAIDRKWHYRHEPAAV